MNIWYAKLAGHKNHSPKYRQYNIKELRMRPGKNAIPRYTVGYWGWHETKEMFGKHLTEQNKIHSKSSNSHSRSKSKCTMHILLVIFYTTARHRATESIRDRHFSQELSLLHRQFFKSRCYKQWKFVCPHMRESMNTEHTKQMFPIPSPHFETPTKISPN